MNSSASVSVYALGFLRQAARLFFALALAGTANHAAGAQVSGQVLNGATGAFLEGAELRFENGQPSVFTDRQGRFELPLPPGTAVAQVSYTGLDTKTVTWSVTEGENTFRQIELTSSIYTMQKFTVAGLREGNALAIRVQQQAMNVKNVVASDSFGNVADGNIGNLLERIPGITANYSADDARTVQIRGLDASLNSVTMDGDRIASSQSAGLGRQFEFEQMSLGLIESVEVTKAPTPDMDADSIGGNVNLITKSPFDRAVKRYFSYTFGGVYATRYKTRTGDWTREPIDNIGPSLNFTYADRFGPGQKLGLLVTGSHHSTPGGTTAALMSYQNTLTEPYYIYSAIAPRPAGAPRTRASGGIKLDYKMSPHTTLTLNTTYNWFHENNDTRTRNLSTGQAAANFAPGYSGRYSQVLPVAASQSAITVRADDKTGRTYQFAPSVKHRHPTWELDYSGSYSNSVTYYENRAENRHYDSFPTGTVSMNLPNIGWIVDRRNDPEWPVITQTAGPDMYNLTNYRSMLLSHLDRGGEDSLLNGRVNLRKQLGFARPTFVKIGAAYREQARSTFNQNRRFNYVGADGLQNNADDQLGQFLDTRDKFTDANRDYRQPAWPNVPAIAAHLRDHPELWREDLAYAASQKAVNDRSAVETVTSTYAMGNTRLGALSMLTGVRMEQTKTDAEGPLQRGGAVIGRERQTGAYRNFFPGVHLKYAPRSGWVARASYTTSIGRPSFGSIIPLDTVNDTNRTITRSNPSLEPQFSDNADVSLEYYFEPAGMISLSGFSKEIDGFQFTDNSTQVGTGPDNGYDGQYAGYTISEPRNGGHARYRGLEFSFQQRLSFLPGFWRGFGVNLNFTLLKTRGNYGGRVTTTELANFIPKAANFSINYIYRGWTIWINALWRDSYLTSVNANPALTLYQNPRTQVSLKLKYDLSRKLGFYCNLEQLEGFGYAPITSVYAGSKDRPTNTVLSSPRIVAGIQGTF